MLSKSECMGQEKPWHLSRLDRKIVTSDELLLELISHVDLNSTAEINKCLYSYIWGKMHSMIYIVKLLSTFPDLGSGFKLCTALH